MTPIELEDEYRNRSKKELLDLIDDLKMQLDSKHKSLRDINTFQCVDNELYLRGKDEWGKDFTVCFDAFNFLEWIDKEYMKQKVIEYIENK